MKDEQRSEQIEEQKGKKWKQHRDLPQTLYKIKLRQKQRNAVARHLLIYQRKVPQPKGMSGTVIRDWGGNLRVETLLLFWLIIMGGQADFNWQQA